VNSRLGAGGFAASAAGSGLVKLAAAALMLINTTVLSRVLGPEGFGVYSLALIAITFFALPLNFSLSTVVLREIAAAREREQWRAAKGLMYFAAAVVALFTSGVALAMLAAIVFTQPTGSSLLIAALAMGLLYLPFHAASEIGSAILRGLGRIVSGQIPDQIVRHGGLLLLIVVASTAFGPGWIGPEQAMQATAAAVAVATIVCLLAIRSVLPPTARRHSPSVDWQAWLHSLWPLALLAAVQSVYLHTDTLLLGLLAEPADVGVFRAAAQCSLLVSFALLAVNPAVAAHVARLHARGEQAELQRILTWTARTVLIVALPVFAALTLFGGPILTLLFGAAYAHGAPVLTVLAVGQLANAATGSVGLALNMTGNERDTMLGLAVAAVCSVAFNLALIPPLGIVGAALATAASTIVWNVVLVQRLHRRTGLVSFAIPLWRRGQTP
jgi:O-antigen/teichoic acid export membrane protein